MSAKPRAYDGRGFSVIETVASATIFLLIFGLGVFAVTRGFRLYSESTVRQGLQREVQAISAFMVEDGSKTNFFRTSNVPNLNTAGESRDSLGMVALSSWQGSVPLDALGVPAWNNFIGYFATDGEQGDFIRQVVRPAAVPIQETEVLPLLNSMITNTLDPKDTLVSEKILSRSVGRFAVTPDLNNGMWRCDLGLRQKLVSSDGLGSQTEALSVTILLVPQNTWPRVD